MRNLLSQHLVVQFVAFQVLSIVGDYFGRPISLFTAVMTSKTFSLYNKVYRLLRSKFPDFVPSEIQSDYEWSSKKALKLNFPHSRVLGCR